MKNVQGLNQSRFHWLILMILICGLLCSCGNFNPKVESSENLPPLTFEKPVAFEKSDDCSFPDPKGLVSDYENFISLPTVESLEKKLSRLKANHQIELAVVIIATTGKESIDDYSLRLARCWKIGAKAAKRGGVLLLIARKDRNWRIQVSESLEKVLPDRRVKEIGDRMSEEFKANNYDKGINQAVNDLMARVEKPAI